MIKVTKKIKLPCGTAHPGDYLKKTEGGKIIIIRKNELDRPNIFGDNTFSDIFGDIFK